jgi:DNA-binding Xre family transcriptional regulator
MGTYKKITIFLHDDDYNEIEKILHYRNSKVMALNLDKKSRSVEEFTKGCINYYLKQVKNQEELAGIDDLGKPYRLKNRFKEIMEKKGLRGKDLSELTNIHQGNISIVLSNRSQPSLDYFLRIWIALGCPPLNQCLYRVEDEEDDDSNITKK